MYLKTTTPTGSYILNEYQKFTDTTAIYRDNIDRMTDTNSMQRKLKIAYAAMELMDESSEVCGKIKKMLRGDKNMSETAELVKGELGDVFYPLACLCTEFGFTMEEVIEYNREKLQSRLDRNMIKGDGDFR